MAYLVHIASASEKAAPLAEKCLQAGWETQVFSQPAELLAALEKTLPDIVLAEYSFFPRGKELPESLSKAPLLIFAEEMDPDTRLEWYQRGAARVVSGGEDFPARVSAFAGMVLHRKNTVRRTRQTSVTYGWLQAFSLAEVLQNALLEKKNLILKIRYKDRDVKIRTFQGHIVDAVTAHLTREDAVLKAMMFPGGSSIIRGYQKLEERAALPASTLAILAETRFTRARVRKFLESFAGGAANPEFRIASPQRAAGLPEDRAQVLELLQKYPAFQDILLYSPLPVLKTVYALATLATRGVIAHKGEAEVVETFQLQDIEYIRKTLLSEEARSGNLVILGMPESGRSELVRTLAGFQKGSIKSVQSLDFVRIPLQGNLTLTVFGVSTDQNLLTVLEKISPGMIAGILLIDYRQKDQYEFLNYLFSRIIQLYPVPFVVGLTNVKGDLVKAVKEVRKNFNLPKNIDVVPVNADSFPDARKLLYHLHPAPVPAEQGEPHA